MPHLIRLRHTLLSRAPTCDTQARFLVERRAFTCAVAQMPDVDLLLLYTRCFSNETGIVIGTPIGSAHRVKAVPTAVYITHTPVERDDSHLHQTTKGFTVQQQQPQTATPVSLPSVTQGRTMLYITNNSSVNWMLG